MKFEADLKERHIRPYASALKLKVLQTNECEGLLFKWIQHHCSQTGLDHLMNKLVVVRRCLILLSLGSSGGSRRVWTLYVAHLMNYLNQHQTHPTCLLYTSDAADE